MINKWNASFGLCSGEERWIWKVLENSDATSDRSDFILANEKMPVFQNPLSWAFFQTLA